MEKLPREGKSQEIKRERKTLVLIPALGESTSNDTRVSLLFSHRIRRELPSFRLVSFCLFRNNPSGWGVQLGSIAGSFRNP